MLPGGIDSERAEPAHEVSLCGFELGDLGAEIAEQARCERAGDAVSDLEDDDALESPRRGFLRHRDSPGNG